MNTQYIKTPLANFLYRLIITVLGGGMILPFLLQDGWVYLFSATLLLIAIPIMYGSLFSLAQYDQKEYHTTKCYPAKGLLMGLLTLIPVLTGMLVLGFCLRSTGGFLTGMNIAYRVYYTPYMAIIGLKTTGFTILYILPVLIDITAMTLGYIAGMNDYSVKKKLRQNFLYEKKEPKEKQK